MLTELFKSIYENMYLTKDGMFPDDAIEILLRMFATTTSCDLNDIFKDTDKRRLDCNVKVAIVPISVLV